MGIDRKRKWAGLSALAVMGGLAVCGLCGCEKKEGYDSLLDKKTPVTITVWHYYNGIQQTQFDALVDEFNDTVGAEQGIVVEANSKNSVSELSESVLAAVSGEPGADQPPDIFGTYAETAYQLEKMGKLADLAVYFTEEELSGYVEEYMEEGAFAGEGTLKILPTAKSTEVLLVNDTDWQKFAKASEASYEDLATWEGLIRVAEKYYDYTDAQTPDIPDDGKAFFGRDSVANYMVVGAQQLGHAFASAAEDGSVTVSVDRDTVRRLWDNYYVPFVKGYFTAESRFRSDDAKIGSIIALVASSTGSTYFPDEVTIRDEYTYPIESKVLDVPNFEGCAPVVVQQGAGMSVLASDEKTEYACAVFLKWFTQEEQNVQFAVNSGYMPVKKEANDDSVILEKAADAGDTVRNTFRVALDEIRNYTLYTSPPYDQSAEVRTYLGDTMEETARTARDQAWERISQGESREAVLAEYTDDAAFGAWYASFEQGFSEILGE